MIHLLWGVKVGKRPIGNAIDQGNLQMVKLLINRGAKPELTGGTVLDYALERLFYNAPKMRPFIDYFVELKIPTKLKNPILISLIFGDIDAVKKWLNPITINNLSRIEF